LLCGGLNRRLKDNCLLKAGGFDQIRLRRTKARLENKTLNVFVNTPVLTFFDLGLYYY